MLNRKKGTSRSCSLGISYSRGREKRSSKWRALWKFRVGSSRRPAKIRCAGAGLSLTFREPRTKRTIDEACVSSVHSATKPTATGTPEQIFTKRLTQLRRDKRIPWISSEVRQIAQLKHSRACARAWSAPAGSSSRTKRWSGAGVRGGEA